MGQLSAPDMPAAEWLEITKTRQSRRSYDGSAIEADVLDALDRFTVSFSPSPITRVALVRHAPADIFSGMVGSYGRISGAPSALVFLGTKGAPGVDAAVGYVGEALILEASRLGLSTCWVGGFFKAHKVAEIVHMGGGEKTFAISPLGIPAQVVTGTERLVYGMKDTPKPRKPVEEVAPGSQGWPEWARLGVDAARSAPSAMNRQPWRFSFDDGRVMIRFVGADSPKISKRLDCGIAMLHFEVAVRAAGLSGVWERREAANEVAQFRLD